METFTYGSTRASGCNSPGPLTRPLAAIGDEENSAIPIAAFCLRPQPVNATPKL